jgi:hemerythrin
MLAWSDKFVTGHPLIDHQHRMLISFINRLERLSYTTEFNTRETVLVREFISFVETYLATHFRDEEKCMQRLKCPAHLENQKAHAEFVDFFGKFKSRFVCEGCRPELVRELFNFCVFWIQRHILRIDIQLRSCHEESVGVGPGDLD